MDILGILGKIGFDWQVALANFVNFLLIFWILKKFAWKPIRTILERRQAVIKEGVENAKRAETELGVSKRKSEKIISEARAEANTIIVDARAQGSEILEESKAGAERKFEEIIQKAEEKAEGVQAEKDKEFKKQAAGLVLFGVETLLRENMDEKINEEVAKKALLSVG
jgi:F-type H+-transporting ATPase subunit b